MSDSKMPILFEPLDTTIKQAYYLKKLYDICPDADMFDVFGRGREMHSIDYLSHIMEIQLRYKQIGCCAFFVFQGEQPSGFVTAIPVRDETHLKEYALHMVLSDKSLLNDVNKAFQMNVSKLLSGKMTRTEPVHVFTPACGESVLPLYRLPFDMRATAGDSFLSCLSKTLPNKIVVDTDVMLNRLSVNDKTSELVFNLFERNRYLANKYLIGLSSSCSDVEKTKSFLGGKTQVHQGRLSVFYGLYYCSELVGLIEWSCRGCDATVNLMIDERCTGKGYGSEVLRLTEREFFMRGVQNIFMECNMQNDGAVSVLNHNRYVFEDNDMADGFYYYHKTLENYNAGRVVNSSLLKMWQRWQNEKK